MKGRLIALDHLDGREAAALMVDGQLDDLLIASPDMPAPGTIYRGIVDRPLKGQGGVMVKLPGGATGYLRRVKGLAPGQPILVMTTGYAEAGKAVPVTDRILFKSRFAIVTPGAPGLNVSRAIKDDDRRDILTVLAREGMEGADAGLILRSLAETAEDLEIVDDIAQMREACEGLMASDGSTPELLRDGDGPHLWAWREWGDADTIDTEPGSFETHGVLDALEGVKAAHVPLGPHGMYVEPTRALIAVDVNTGADTSPAAPLKANIAALRALPRALRLRGLAGQITVDLAPVLNKDRKLIESTLRGALRQDWIDTEFVGWTPMGHLELKRKRERRPLTEILS